MQLLLTPPETLIILRIIKVSGGTQGGGRAARAEAKRPAKIKKICFPIISWCMRVFALSLYQKVVSLILFQKVVSICLFQKVVSLWLYQKWVPLWLFQKVVSLCLYFWEIWL